MIFPRQQEHVTIAVEGVPFDGLLKLSLTYSADNVVRKATMEVKDPLRMLSVGKLVVVASNGDLLLTGSVTKRQSKISTGKGIRTIHLESKARKALKTAAQSKDHSLAKKSVADAAKALLAKVEVPVHDEAGGKTYNWKWAPGAKAFDVIAEQARSANLLVMGHGDGGIVIAKGIRGSHMGTLAVPGEILDASCDMGDENEFEETIVLGQKPEGAKKDALRPEAKAKGAVTEGTKGTVQILLNETDFDATDLVNRAKARRDRRRASDVSASLTLAIWRDAAGVLWEPAYEIMVDALDDLDLQQAVAINSVTLTYEKGDVGCTLDVVDPPALNGEGKKGKSKKEWNPPTANPKYDEEE